MGVTRKRGHAAGQRPRLSKARLDELVEEALVDAFGESEQVSGFYTMMENDLRLPFETEVLGVTVIVEAIDITDDDQLVAVCRKNKIGNGSHSQNYRCPWPCRREPSGSRVSILADGQNSMSAKIRKRAAAGAARQDTSVRKDVQEAIDRIWPDGIVEMLLDPDESYFVEVHSKLSRALRRIGNASLVYEREADGGPVWSEESDPEDDPPDETERSHSYHTFFVSPDGERFTFETESEVTEPEFATADFADAEWEEEPDVNRISGTGRTGWVVAVSRLAPFAVIELGDIVTYEDGSTTGAEIESYAQTPDGEPIDSEKHFREAYGASAYKTISSLRVKIAGILDGFGIVALPPQEWRKPVPWLRGSEETLIGLDGRGIRVLDAFFFESL